MKLLAVHHGGELYGSDRCFAQSVLAFRRAWPDAEIHVQLGSDGPLRRLIESASDSITIAPLWIARRSAILQTLLDLPRFLGRLPRTVWQMRDYDIVYVNTIVILDYLLPSLFFRNRSILHVHEITPDTWLGKLLRQAVRKSRSGRIFNSEATAKSFGLLNSANTAIVLNGVDAPRVVMPLVRNAGIQIALLGRINEWKGQDLALQALSLLPRQMQDKISLRFVGDAFKGQKQIEHNLLSEINRLGMESIVTIVPFRSDVEEHYNWANVVIVPSRRPEPFGRVAIEAMSHGRPVIVADHGGLAEIVEHGQSGILVAPNDAFALAEAIKYLAENPDEILRLGQGALKRYEAKFTEARMERCLIEAVKELSARGDSCTTAQMSK